MRNELRLQAAPDFRACIERLLYVGLELGNDTPELSPEHWSLFEAARKRDVIAARQVMQEHVTGSKQKIIPLL